MIVNLTQHPASQEQKDVGVFDLPEYDREELISDLTFDKIPDRDMVEGRAANITEMAASTGAKNAMIGGALWLMEPLQRHLVYANIQYHYAFTKRIVVEKNGVKTSVFKHEGFYPPYDPSITLPY